MSNTILEVIDLKTYYIEKNRVVKAVDGVSFSINEEETFGLVGESGCGKSATCRSLIGLVHKPGEIVNGCINYKGTDLLKISPKELEKIRGSEMGMIFQEPMTALNPVLKIKEQIMESFKDKALSKQQKYEKAIELLRLVGIPSPEKRMESFPHQFSGGMRQRVMIAIALASKPRLLLADEPTTALDVTIQDQIIKLLNDLKRELKMSMILVTHDLGVAAQMCDRMAVMYAGNIMEITDAVTLFGSPRHPYTIGLLNSLAVNKEKGGKLQPINGAPPDLSNMPEGCPFAPRCQYCEPLCEKQLPDLQEIEPGHLSRCRCVEKLANIKGIIEPAGKEEPS
ncbi:ABC transporter ATP-binding protein [Desulfosporosinus sp. FKB]|uniref:ABC transporter ATP-binding protein n=1 Tax=Desulfosporosinus sp. FKB TaxID=1969835 RepID=UPI000B49CC78|nr:ABC transporter ATP-binding protein [Desulfosporosinus sp. FKB]